MSAVQLHVPAVYDQTTTWGAVVDVGTTDPMACEWLRLGVQAALEGNREDARYYFVQAVRTDLDYARGWLYLAGVADDPALTLSCLQKVLQLDPDEPQARAGLIWARNALGLLQPSLLALGVPGIPNPVGAPPPPAPGVQTVDVVPWAAPPAPASTNGHSEAPARPPAAAPPAPVVAQPVARPAETSSPAPVDEARPEPEHDSSSWLMCRGSAAAAGGDRARARYYFLKAIAADAGNTRAWLYFGGVAEDPSTTLACMERVLRAEPWNREARAGADWAVRRLGITTPAMRWWK